MTQATLQAHALSAPSPWIARWTQLLPAGCSVLDVACGSGRHLQWFAAHGHAVLGVDLDTSAARSHVPQAQLLQADIENAPWPLLTYAEHPEGPPVSQPRQFGAVIVTNYLWRPLLPTLLRSLAPGGLLLYETFAAGNETVGRPARPDFLLQPGELLQLCAPLQVVAYEHGFLAEPARFVQRIAAFAPALPGAQPAEIPRHLL